VIASKLYCCFYHAVTHNQLRASLKEESLSKEEERRESGEERRERGEEKRFGGGELWDLWSTRTVAYFVSNVNSGACLPLPHHTRVANGGCSNQCGVSNLWEGAGEECLKGKKSWTLYSFTARSVLAYKFIPPAYCFVNNWTAFYSSWLLLCMVPETWSKVRSVCFIWSSSYTFISLLSGT